MHGSDSARLRLQQSLLKLSHAKAAGANAARRSTDPARTAGIPAARVAVPLAPPNDEPEPSVEPTPEGPSAAEIAADLVERLDRIEERLADLTRPARPIPATRELFAEWVRLRKWEEMAFGDFLRLRRSGVV